MPVVSQTARPNWLPVSVLLFSASIWGLMWWPLKHFSAAGLSGPTLALLSYGVVGLVGLPLLWRQRAAWRAQTGSLILLALVGGWANNSFVHALMIGDVVRVMLLFYLAPIWSVIGGRVFLGERVTRRRAAAVALAVFGAFMVIGGMAALRNPLSLADVLALSAGLAFAGNNLVARAAQAIPMLSKTVAVFVGCGVVAAVATAFQGAEWPVLTAPLGASVLAYGFGWLVLATATWQYGVTHLEAGRSGVIMIAELMVAVFSAMLIGGAQLAPREWLGGALIAAAALLEATDGGPSNSEES